MVSGLHEASTLPEAVGVDVALTVTFVVGLSLPIDRVLLFWALRSSPAPSSSCRGDLATASARGLPWRRAAPRANLDLHPVLSLLACFHFGYHYEHHARPDLPWWRLWQVRGMGESPRRHHRAGALLAWNTPPSDEPIAPSLSRAQCTSSANSSAKKSTRARTLPRRAFRGSYRRYTLVSGPGSFGSPPCPRTSTK